MALDLTNVECFVAVAEIRHFGRVAQSLGVSVPTVTKRIHRLETALGVPLVLRSSAGVAGLTPAGSRLLEVAPELLRAAQAATELAQGEPTSELHVAVPSGVDAVAPLLPAALGTLELALRHSYPGVAVLAVPTPFGRLTDDLLAGRVDAVLTFGATSHAEIISTRLAPLHRVGLVGAQHPLAKRRSVPAREFAEQPLLFSPGLPDHYMLPFVLADVRPVAQGRLVPISASTTAHVAQRILLGREVTVVPIALTGNLPPELVRIFLTGLPPAWYYAHHRASDGRPELATAIELMADFTDSINRAAVHGVS